VASGNGSTTVGARSNALGEASSAFGFTSVASGNLSSAFGVNSTASNGGATAIGGGGGPISGTINGQPVTVTPNATTASGFFSSAFGVGSGATGDLSTALGAFIPVLPFFFASGITALVISFVISTAAHFNVGASKTIVTGRSWFKSGTEMTVVGLGEAVVTYVIGLLISPALG